MGRIIKMDFYRIFCSIRFWAAAAAVAFLWNVAGQRFSWSGDVLGIIFHGIGRSTVTLIAVVVCNAAYGLGVCEDIQNGEFWNIMSRVSKKKYVFSKIVSCMLGTTSCYFLGAMLSVFIMIFKYPLVLDNSMTVENLKEDGGVFDGSGLRAEFFAAAGSRWPGRDTRRPEFVAFGRAAVSV